ncbi:MAG: hypothetical protein FWD92_01710, partial [Methanomassiliicoccaceae archaeon]|nr:hypothetical protein [Methanomassiliicoccaceae archaeon]
MRKGIAKPYRPDPRIKSVKGEGEIRTGKKEERTAGRKGTPAFGLLRTALKPKAMISVFAALILLTASLSMLPDGSDDEKDVFDKIGSSTYVHVTDITNVPTAALAGMPLTLTGTVLPIDATNKTITWSLKDAGTAGASLSGNILTAPNTGTATVTASVQENNQFVMVSAGDGYTMAIKDDGTLWAWGNNDVGQLGLNNTVQRDVPTQVGIANDWAYISAGLNHAMAIKKNGTLWAWGQNTNGQLGDNSLTQRNAPVQVGTVTTWASVSAGSDHTVAIRTDGTMWSWGGNTYGQLGDGTHAQKQSPARVGTATDWKYVSVGAGYSAAIKTNGELWTWGSNNHGQLGHGASGMDSDEIIPKRVGTATDWASISAGYNHIMAIKTNGELWGWGRNSEGQLGDNTGITRTSPNQIGTEVTWASVSAGWGNTIAIKKNGTMWAWGFSQFGQIGLGDTISVRYPAQIGTATTWASVSNGSEHAIAFNTKGELYTWGRNMDGQLGFGNHGDGTERKVPNLLMTLGTSYFTKDFVITAMERNYHYEITASGVAGGNLFTAVGYMSDNVSKYTVIEDMPIQAVINVIRTDANGNACIIDFKGTPLNLGPWSIQFTNATISWGTITLKGALTSNLANDLITVSDNVNVISQADITGNIKNNGTGTVNVTAG